MEMTEQTPLETYRLNLDPQSAKNLGKRLLKLARRETKRREWSVDAPRDDAVLCRFVFAIKEP